MNKANVRFSLDAVRLLNGDCNGLSGLIEKTVKVLTNSDETIKFAVGISRKIEESKNKLIIGDYISLLGELLVELVDEKIWESTMGGKN